MWSDLAAQGDAKARSNLGLMYAKGDGVPQDYAKAIEWFTEAAAQGRVRFCFFVVLMRPTIA